MAVRTAASAYLWLVTSVLFLLAAWRQPSERAACLSIAVVFGIVAARSLRRRANY